MDGANRDANRALRARFDEVYGQYERLRSGLADLQGQLAAFRATESSDDGLVTATVGPRGQLVKLELDRRIYRDGDANALAAKITATVQRAADAASVGVQGLVGNYLPAGSGAADFLKDGDFGSLLRRSDAALREEAERRE
ncbi:YbaB/EbfC family nucleoid-associated protein [Plantactinospora sp. B5E13]|uniref:YbaB/EbfC family nucleoid-associated protein n=1 Tax=unclassified Plantactinospora TaxID=2631981 RepID=UPI00325F1EF7